MRNPAPAAVTAAAVVLIAAAVGGCSNEGGGTAPSRTQTPSATGPATASPAATVHARKDPLGTFLVDAQGRTLYLFEADRGRYSTCFGDCAKDWPPLTIPHGLPSAGAGVQEGLVGTFRRDGGRQITYNGHPLYYYAGDRRPGDVKGQNSHDHGAKWYVVAPNGHPITGPAPSPSGTHGGS
ncbi:MULTISPECIES: hypothetical protein [unclassified Streptomyces]|uniref:COG4315 family predicted lipoprotein n=1 Tax=unclassified Streptomyces TaxID=2593676 RepID=UPI00344F587B